MKTNDQVIENMLSDPTVRVMEDGKVQRLKNGEWIHCGYSSWSNERKTYMRTKYKRKTVYIHRLVYVALVGPIPEQHVIDHIDGNTKNNHPSNLKLSSISDNLKNRKKEWRCRKHLTATEENNIVKDRQKGMSLKDITEKYRISTQTLGKVMERKI